METKDKFHETATTLHFKVDDVVLTPHARASIVLEMLKTLLYQKLQIPYNFKFLKDVVSKRRTNDTTINLKDCNFTALNYFKKASATLDVIERVLASITEEFSSENKSIKEIVFVLGTVPVCPSEVYRINFTKMRNGHDEDIQKCVKSKSINKILRNIFWSQFWINCMAAKLTLTNTYVYIIKDEVSSSTEDYTDKFFVPSNPLIFSSNVKQYLVFIGCENNSDCCSFKVFADDAMGNHTSTNQIADLLETENVKNPSIGGLHWFEGKMPIKGFKDCYINKVSAIELW